MATWSRELQITKLDAPRRAIYGWLSKIQDEAGQSITDLQGDEIPVAELEEAARRFMLDSRAGDILHAGERVGEIFESFLSTPEKRAAQGIVSDDQSIGWWIGLQTSEDVFKRVASGELQAFSIGGAAEVEVID